MKTNACLCRVLILSCLVALASPPLGKAQTVPRPSVPSKTNSVPTAPSRQVSGPFRGKLAALDKTAKTIVVGKRTFHVTAETRIIKAGASATLNDGVLQEEASGYFVTAPDGRLTLKSLRFGPKSDAEKEAPSKKKAK